ncbi:MAG: hypothetical protein GWN73_30380, partial [Actinobacteria bacterium]|nr:hypothetical protein [Actinomycetota bacterium]NIS34708.1 hypothetical protein [Actinomycetota bacterium]NIU69466.1 hypothetical protein [Actinomycetota bacterium]NIW31332.1 hypothetical protein [Actinomycetota bacterium]
MGTGSTTITAESRGAVATAEVSVDVRLVNVTTRFTHTCGVTDRGRVACWGGNGFGELGNGTLFGSGAPALVT